MKNERLLHEVNIVLEHISTALDVERSSFFLLNNKTATLDSIAAQEIENPIFSIPIGKGIAGSVAMRRTPIIENDAQNSPLFDNSYDSQLNFKTRSIICIPVDNQLGKTIGVIQCLNKRKGIFTEHDIIVLNSFAATISLIIKNAQLYFTSEEVKNNFSVLLDVFGTVSSELDLDNLIPLIMSKAAKITNADRSSLFFLDKETGELWTKYAKGLKSEIIRTKKGIVSLVAKNKTSSIINDAHSHPSFDSSIDKKTGYVTKSILCVPIFDVQNEVLGVVQVINKTEGVFKEEDLFILEGFASQIRIAIENAQLFSQINGMKNYLNILIENLDNGILTVDKSNNIQTVNTTFCKMFDLSQHENIVNKKIDVLDKKLFSILKYGGDTMRTGKRHYEYGISYETEKQKNIIANLSTLPMQDSNGKIVGAINVFQDVTREKRIRANLSRYIPHHIVNEVINKDDLSIMQSKNRKCTILFSDIRNFTKLTEELGATQIVDLLNKYFDVMVNAIHTHNGILDKFIGDAIMAVFGVPYTNSSDSVNAVRCALNMFKMLDNLNENKNIAAKLNIGVGISTGNVISGNIGSEKRFEYTVIGDPVNIAARLESETKKYDVPILVCENTYHNIVDYFFCEEIDSVVLKGKQHSVKIYTVVKEK
ncbi:GAF domain-containing protein [Sungkyunkwania multivorans]|uniref:GAF domain-containing protein n=1 Tax=Sungkyunkwania multivorans TaxID=1173618 RepID=A0ABW3CYQ7_9FLAO